MKKLILLFIPCFLLLSGCERNPVGALLYPSTGESGSWASEFVIYDDIIKTRGPFDPFMFTNWVDLGRGSLNFESDEKSYRGRKSIKMSWDGGESNPMPSGSLQFAYVGFGLPAKGFSEDPGVTFNGYDISPGNYTKMQMYVRGNMSQNVSLEIKAAVDIAEAEAGMYQLVSLPNDGQWHKVEFPLTNTSALTSVKTMVAFSLKLINESQKSNGATIYIDEIRLIK